MSQEEAYRLIELCLEYDKDMSDYPERYDMALCIAREVFMAQSRVEMLIAEEHKAQLDVLSDMGEI